MNRSQFLRDTFHWIGASLTAIFLRRSDLQAAQAEVPCEQQLKQQAHEREIISNWLNDLWDAIDTQVDEKTKVKLIEGCGRGCFLRHQFKRDIAAQGQGSIDRLIEAYKKNFEIWREGDLVHIRYGAVTKACYCPVAKYRPIKPNDLHCECTRMTHQSIFETALSRPFKVDVVESLRRGGKNCHFVVHLT